MKVLKQLRRIDDYLKRHPKTSWFCTTIAPGLSALWWVVWAIVYHVPEAVFWAAAGIVFGWGIAYFNKRYGADQVKRLKNNRSNKAS